MARVEDKKKAIEMRKLGKSYSQIKDELGISKSTLSYWLKNYPLKSKDLKRLRDNNPKRIESFRKTMADKRQERLEVVYSQARYDIKKLSKRDIFIAGLFLYWGEGTKTSRYRTEVTNTDPSMIIFFIKWLDNQKVDRSSLRIKLHLYVDMNQEKEEKYWSRTLCIPRSQFQKTQVKKSGSKSGIYKGRFEHGTCSVIVDNRDLSEYVTQSLKYLQDLYMHP